MSLDPFRAGGLPSAAALERTGAELSLLSKIYGMGTLEPRMHGRAHRSPMHDHRCLCL